ncbi:HAD-IB family hydrolase [Sphingomonas sabuli]|uniref:HAD-IB family hydrolase n=1 Tax=Sphingomonas sabuli TaxID=2764186 RepID=A0A7G9L1B4_9SPHN|nr:HAD-IB family hydrolase [Sphingomonas sabuli]QNM82413.1 HAD-IB family hydrolase [Sphingomonas sabuli]
MADLAVYDLDRTITRLPTYTPFLIHCALRRQQWRLLFLPLVALAMLGYLLKLYDRGRLKEMCQALLVGRHISAATLKPLADSFADQTVAGNVRPGARRAIDRDRGQGRRLVLATASYRLYADAIAQRLGFDDVIATGSVIGLDDRVAAKIDGDNCYGPAKLWMISEWVERSGLLGKHGHVRFYSDHASDAPTFEWADEPVAVNPHDKLKRLAQRRGWAIEDWS